MERDVEARVVWVALPKPAGHRSKERLADPARLGPARDDRAAQGGVVVASGQDAAADDRQWDEALRVASGERAAVDPAKVKKALKLREKKKKKSAKEWAARGRASARAVAAKKVPSGREYMTTKTCGDTNVARVR